MSKGKRHHQTEEMEEDSRQASARGEPGESDMMVMFRAMMAEQRMADNARQKADDAREEKRMIEEQRREEARQAEVRRLEEARQVEMRRLEDVRVQRELEVVAKQAELQKELEQRQYDQQVALLKIQKEMGEAASLANREFHTTDRKRDRALYGIPLLKEGEDLEEFLSTAERMLGVAEVRKADWISIIDSKLSGKTASIWQDILVTTNDYQEAKDGLLKSCGYTPKSAAEKLFSFRVEQSRGLTADQLYHRGQQLLRRVVAPGRLPEGMEFPILRGWIVGVIPKRAKAALDARTIETSLGLVNALRDFLELEGDKNESQSAIFKKNGSELVRERSSTLTCFKCGKAGHKAADCWKGGASAHKTGSASSGGAASKPIVCYTCGEEGHKSPQCTKYVKSDKGAIKDSNAKPRPVKSVWHSHPGCAQVMGVVDGTATPILLDSGASISVVPESLVAPERLAGGRVAVKPFGAREPILLPIADVTFQIGELEWEERVAVAPRQEGVEEEVLCSLDIVSERGLKLVLMANSIDSKEVSRVTTRAQAKTDRQEREEEVTQQREDGPLIKPISEALIEVQEEEEEVGGVLGIPEEDARESLGIETDAYEDCDEDEYALKKMTGEAPDLEVPLVRAGLGSRAALLLEVRSDPSLLKWRALADEKKEGFKWKEDLMYKTVTTHILEVVELLVLPKSFRKRVMDLAHEKLNHMGSRRVLSLLREKVSWPGMGQDVIKHCRSCDICQKCSKPKARQVPMMERQVMTEPFEALAFDVVGPLPKGKGGCTFLLTCICMASRWPEAIPLRSVTASAVAQGMLEIFSRTGVPLRIISDQGPQFVGKVITKLCKNLHIENIMTSPYRAQGNGVVERMHGTLGAMLTKAASSGLDWVGQIPFALFALRSAPNRDSGFSPFELCYGRHVRTPLDILHQGWAQKEFKELDTDEWAQWLVERLECWHDVARERGEDASSKRKLDFDKRGLWRKEIWCCVGCQG